MTQRIGSQSMMNIGLLIEGVWHLFNEGHWQHGRPDFNGMVEL